MKNLLLLICMLIASNAFATVIRVNNREASVPEENTYDNLEDAYNKAQPGDTLYVLGSPEAYGSLTLTKPLTIIGPGYFLTENPNTQANKQPATVQPFSFNAGSEGSKVIGISFSIGYLRISTNDIELSKCYITRAIYVYVGSLRDININRCYFTDRAIAFNPSRIPPNDFYFANNIVLGEFILPDGTSGTIIHNVFVHNIFQVGESSTLEIHNNILLGTNAEEVTIPPLESNISHNIAALQQFGTANGNQANVGVAQIFVAGGSTEGTTDGKWQLKVGGAADGKGRNGADIGAFGGPAPYRLSGLPSIPRIVDLSTDGYVNEEGKLLIQIKVTAN